MFKHLYKILITNKKIYEIYLLEKNDVLSSFLSNEKI